MLEAVKEPTAFLGQLMHSLSFALEKTPELDVRELHGAISACTDCLMRGIEVDEAAKLACKVLTRTRMAEVGGSAPFVSIRALLRNAALEGPTVDLAVMKGLEAEQWDLLSDVLGGETSLSDDVRSKVFEALVANVEDHVDVASVALKNAGKQYGFLADERRLFLEVFLHEVCSCTTLRKKKLEKTKFWLALAWNETGSFLTVELFPVFFGHSLTTRGRGKSRPTPGRKLLAEFCTLKWGGLKVKAC